MWLTEPYTQTVSCDPQSPINCNPLSQIMKAETQRINDLPNAKVPEPDLMAGLLWKFAFPVYFQMDTFFIGHFSPAPPKPGCVGEKAEKW